MKQLRVRAEEAKLAGDKIYERYQEVEALLELVRGRKDWSGIERELGGKVKMDRAKGKLEVEL